jgi:hypothetical protein
MLLTPNSSAGCIGRLKTLPAFFEAFILPAAIHAAAYAGALTLSLQLGFHITTYSLDWDLVSTTIMLTVPARLSVLQLGLVLPSGIVVARIEAAPLPADELVLIRLSQKRPSAVQDGHGSPYAIWLRPTVLAAKSLD